MTDKDSKSIVNFVVLQSVEDYVEKSGKFRTECSSFKIPGRDSGGANTLYIPYCEKQRFDFGPVLNDFRGHGVFTPPEVGKPWEIPDFVVFREHFHDIRCPQPCRGYSDNRVVVENEKPTPPQVSKELAVGSTVDGKWTKKEIASLVAVPVVIGLLTAVLGWVTPEGRRLLHLDKPQAEQQTSSPGVSPTAPRTDSAPPPSKLEPKVESKPKVNGRNKVVGHSAVGNNTMETGNVSGSIVNNGGVINNPTINNTSPNAPVENQRTTATVTAIVKPPSVVDWHDKYNWRKYLLTGLTRKDVREIFGEPEKMSVYGTLEMWDYGSGRITFRMESGTPDGSLYSWYEPSR